MKSWTVLRAYCIVYLTCCIIYTIAKWDILSSGEGWGVVGMVGLTSLGLAGLVADFVLALLFKSKRMLNAIELTIAIGFSMMLWFSFR